MTTEEKILNLFKGNKDSFLSGEEVSQSLGISRQALWKHIEKLRDAGYVIEAVPHLGYKLRHVPDKMLVQEIKWRLKTKIIGKEIYFYESVGSTNNIAYKLAQEGAEEGAIVIADEQTKGKGRLGRKWVSPPDSGVYLSFILRPDIVPNEVQEVTLVTALGAVKAIRNFAGMNALIKWPNDIIISDKKAGGILTELKAEMDKVEFVVIGIGININTPEKFLPEGATSVKNESKASVDFSRVEFTRELLEGVEREYIKFKNNGFEPTRSEFKGYSCTLGREVSVTGSAGKKIHGKAVDIDKDGALIIKTTTGAQERILSGDVTLVR